MILDSTLREVVKDYLEKELPKVMKEKQKYR